jgi:hypothetical protein
MSITVSGLLNDAFAATKAAWRPALVFAIVFTVIQLVSFPTPEEMMQGPSWVTGLLSLVYLYLWYGLIVAGVAAARGAEPGVPTLAQPLGTVVRAFVVMIVTGIAVALGLLLLVVPGIILGLMWSMTSPLILDGRARLFDAMPASARLTRGHRVKIFLAFLVPLGVMIVLSVLTAPGIGEQTLENPEAYAMPLWLVILQVALTVYMTMLIAVIYQRLLEADGAQVRRDAPPQPS